MNKLKVGIIGCGVIGRELAKACLSRLSERIELAAICDADAGKAAALNEALGGNVAILGLDETIERSDLVAEAASALVSAEVVEKAIAKKRSVLVMSVGGLIGGEELLARAEKAGIKVYIPSGALSGVDGLKSASVGKVEAVTLVTTKPPKGLAGAPYIRERGIDLDGIREKTVIFEGSAKEAVRAFPANINVSAVLSLAGLGPEKTRVRIVADPKSSKNVHEVEIRGDAGAIYTRTENVPSEINPKTSGLAILSAIATLEGAVKSVRIGT